MRERTPENSAQSRVTGVRDGTDFTDCERWRKVGAAKPALFPRLSSEGLMSLKLDSNMTESHFVTIDASMKKRCSISYRTSERHSNRSAANEDVESHVSVLEDEQAGV